MGNGTIAIRIDEDIKSEIEKLAKEQGMKAGVLARHILLQWYNTNKNKQFNLLK